MKLARSAVALTVDLILDEVTASAIAPFDLDPATPVEFYPWCRPALPDTWQIGVIVGASGSGKSTLLREFGTYQAPQWAPDVSIAGHFPDGPTAVDRFSAAGLNSVPTWRKPYRVLSTGEKFRADLARVIGSDTVIDEYTSVVSRSVAQSASRSLRGYVRQNKLTGVVVATCHRDVIPWLAPAWVIDTDSGVLTAGGDHQERWSRTGLDEVGALMMEFQ